MTITKTKKNSIFEEDPYKVSEGFRELSNATKDIIQRIKDNRGFKR